MTDAVSGERKKVCNKEKKSMVIEGAVYNLSCKRLLHQSAHHEIASLWKLNSAICWDQISSKFGMVRQ